MNDNQFSPLLAIESSCDETSAAVLIGGKLVSNVVSSQVIHSLYGGVVPELASRAHLAVISRIVASALAEAELRPEELRGIAVTANPGLVGALIVGANFAKGFALRYGIPIVPVNHIEGHIFSACLEYPELEFPFLALVVSGGHTSIFHVESFAHYEIIGSTRDDAAGEGFDKIAKLLGLGYPGGAKIDRLAKQGNRDAMQFPRPMIHEDHFDFSFSGLKTSVRNFIAKNGVNTEEFSFLSEQNPDELSPENREKFQHLCDICASAQEAIVEVLTKKTIRAAKKIGIKGIVVAGGVSANSRLREELTAQAARRKMRVFVPSFTLCTDNAGMIGYIGWQKLQNGGASPLTFTVNASAIRAERK